MPEYIVQGTGAGLLADISFPHHSENSKLYLNLIYLKISYKKKKICFYSCISSSEIVLRDVIKHARFPFNILIEMQTVTFVDLF